VDILVAQINRTMIAHPQVPHAMARSGFTRLRRMDKKFDGEMKRIMVEIMEEMMPQRVSPLMRRPGNVLPGTVC
jgi:hypothetical protein